MNAVDWGNFPTWISAVGSTGALSATISIIWRDHRKAERADACAVSCWEVSLHDRDREKLPPHSDNIHVQNNATRPIYDIVILIWDGVAVEFKIGHIMRRVLGPSETCAAYVAPSADPFGPSPVAVAFRDSEGNYWLRDLSAQTLHSRNLTPSTREKRHFSQRMVKQRQRNEEANQRIQQEHHPGDTISRSVTAPPWRWPRRWWTPPSTPIG
ncbi:hypothetical protein ACH415_18305 [Streptomyces californicus]|uniref:hypothetical protein n=1 Tax=Streptomyces californicus TaxID=67351 RepID=UPI0037BA0603